TLPGAAIGFFLIRAFLDFCLHCFGAAHSEPGGGTGSTRSPGLVWTTAAVYHFTARNHGDYYDGRDWRGLLGVVRRGVVTARLFRGRCGAFYRRGISRRV